MVERSGGNPLYAEEYIRLLGDRTSPALTEVGCRKPCWR